MIKEVKAQGAHGRKAVAEVGGEGGGYAGLPSTSPPSALTQNNNVASGAAAEVEHAPGGGRLRAAAGAVPEGKRRASPKRAERKASPALQGSEMHGNHRHDGHDTNIYIPRMERGEQRQKGAMKHEEEHDVWPQIEDILNNPNVEDYEFLAADASKHDPYQTPSYPASTVEKMELQLRAAQQLQKVAEKEKAEAEEKMEAMMKELNLLRANLAGREVLHKDSYLLNMELEEEKKKNARLRDAIEILKIDKETAIDMLRKEREEFQIKLAAKDFEIVELRRASAVSVIQMQPAYVNGHSNPIHRATSGNIVQHSAPHHHHGSRGPRATVAESSFQENRLSFQLPLPKQVHAPAIAARSFQGNGKPQAEEGKEEQAASFLEKGMELPADETSTNDCPPGFTRQFLHQEQKIHGDVESQHLNIPYMTVVNPHSLPSLNSSAAEFPNDGVLRLPGNVSLHMLQC
ncbi:hypothetical protein GUITHDRAFT_105880 [Guillardia theta CCMP2712]|uniref:Uncharacterized protein n=1 Tax=Guillardia theta (strain CCMP2712) TaxID=905079 RepID=L1JIH6_GUITC|nr:hypothetical protein GUITHDRAFT_105880 [Guillardia theta CCMP2712]EKX48276.1 hypothetical protein GUITHDRAFT_105880 [Guillardia theta CCMP2712]|eukprot:XP_005835256.1 hypothetical protein GUITHDRAFT_105880 [Guillardia theta CCMP2712]